MLAELLARACRLDWGAHEDRTLCGRMKID
jgi:hypothetical protein